MFGAKNEEEFLSHGPRDLSPERQPDGRNSAEKAEEMIETALREGSHFFEWTHRRIDGEEFPADVLLTRMELEGKVIILATVRDVTERKRAEQTLRESETRYRALFEASPLPKWLYDPTSLAILAVNDAAVEHYGYSRDEFQSMTIKDLRPPEEVPKLLTALERTRPGNHHAGLWKHRKKDGTVIDADVYIHEVTLDGSRLRLAVVLDVTETLRAETKLRESEANLTEAQRIARIGSWTFDLTTNAVTWSAELYRIFGIEATDFSVTYESFISRVHSEDRDLVLATNTAARTQGKSFDVEYRIVLPGGEIKTIHEVGNAVIDTTGKITRLFGVAQDITERKHSEQQLRLQGAALQAAANSIVITDSHGTILWVNPGVQLPDGLFAGRDHRENTTHPQVGQT